MFAIRPLRAAATLIKRLWPGDIGKRWRTLSYRTATGRCPSAEAGPVLVMNPAHESRGDMWPICLRELQP